MLTIEIETEYFVWYNPVRCMYESGDIGKYEANSQYGKSEEHFPLILRLKKDSYHLADRVIKELNAAKSKND